MIHIGHGHGHPGVVVLGDGQMVLEEENQGEQGGHTLRANGRQSKLYAVWNPAHAITRLGQRTQSRDSESFVCECDMCRYAAAAYLRWRWIVRIPFQSNDLA